MTDNLKIDALLISKDPYFAQNIEFIDENKRISCNVCEEGFKPLYPNPNRPVPEDKYTFQKRWLTSDLLNKTHLGFEPDLPGLWKALKLLGKELPLQPRELASNQGNQDPSEPKNQEERSFIQSVQGRSSSESSVNLTKQKDADLLFEVSNFLISKHMPFDSAPQIIEFAPNMSLKS